MSASMDPLPPFADDAIWQCVKCRSTNRSLTFHRSSGAMLCKFAYEPREHIHVLCVGCAADTVMQPADAEAQA